MISKHYFNNAFSLATVQALKILGHLGSDIRNEGSYIGDVGINRYKKVTNDWVAMNFFSFKDDIKPANFVEFEALNPPVILTP